MAVGISEKGGVLIFMFIIGTYFVNTYPIGLPKHISIKMPKLDSGTRAKMIFYHGASAL